VSAGISGVGLYLSDALYEGLLRTVGE